MNLEKIEQIEKEIEKITGKAVLPENTDQILKAATESAMPMGILPMLATLVDKPFDKPDWVFEIKWDGYRSISYLKGPQVELFSRNNNPFHDRYYPLTETLQSWNMNAVFDGEIVVVDENGLPSFNALQNWHDESDGELLMYVFDLLWYESKNLMKLPLVDRHAILKSIFPHDERVRLSEIFPVNGTDFFNEVNRLGLEGIMAKRADSYYLPGERQKDWLKIKANKRQEVVIGGYTINEGTARKFSSILIGVYENGIFKYVGKVGTGFNDMLEKELVKIFKPLIVQESPFQTTGELSEPIPYKPKPAHAQVFWLKPELICEVSFTEMTNDGIFRHPSFKGMRYDKKPGEVVTEVETKASEVIKEE